jgi:hypothetical protein
MRLKEEESQGSDCSENATVSQEFAVVVSLDKSRATLGRSSSWPRFDAVAFSGWAAKARRGASYGVRILVLWGI